MSSSKAKNVEVRKRTPKAKVNLMKSSVYKTKQKEGYQKSVENKIKTLDKVIEKTDKLLCKAGNIPHNSTHNKPQSKAHIIPHKAQDTLSELNADDFAFRAVVQELAPALKKFLKDILLDMNFNNGEFSVFYYNKDMPSRFSIPDTSISNYLCEIRRTFVKVENKHPTKNTKSRKFRKFSADEAMRSKLLELL